MDEVEEVESLNLEYQNIKDLFEDKDSEIFDTILLNGPIEAVKNKLNFLRTRGHRFTVFTGLTFIISL